MSVFIGNKNKRVELAERKDATNPNLLEKSKSFIMVTPWGNIGCGNTIHCTKSIIGSIYLSDDLNNVGIKASRSTYFSCEPNTYYTESLWVTSSVALNDATNGNVTFQNTSATNASVIDPKLINLGNNRYKIVGSFYSGTNMANFDIGYITSFQDFLSADADISFDALKIEKGTVATDWCPALEDYAWNSDITNLQNTVNNINSTRTPIVTGASGDDLFAFRTNQIRLYNGNGQTCKNLPPAAKTDFFTVQYVFEGADSAGVAIYQTPLNEIWIAGCNAGSYNQGWTRVANSTDITNLQNQIQADKTANKTDVTNLQSMITGLSTKVDSLQQNSLKIVPITQADYDALSTKDPNTIYAIGG